MMNDVFMPDWSAAPEWAMFHTVGDDWNGEWWSHSPYLLRWFDFVDVELGGDGIRWTWEHVHEETVVESNESGSFRYTENDYRNSLRVRP